MIEVSNSLTATQKIASDLAKKIRQLADSKPPDKSFVIGLEGELGAGKTTFVKDLAKALGIKEKITSPTFVIMKRYELRDMDYKFLYHIDAYRLKDEKELIKLGIKEIFSDSQDIVLIEWADRVKKILPKGYISIHMDHVSERERKINIKE